MEDDALHVLHITATHPEHARASADVSKALVGAVFVAFTSLFAWAVCSTFPPSPNPFFCGLSFNLLIYGLLMGVVFGVQFWRADRRRTGHPPLDIELTRHQLRMGDQTLDLAQVHRFDPTQDVHLQVGEEQITLPDDYTLGPADREALHAGLRARLEALRGAQTAEVAHERLTRLRSAAEAQGGR